MKTKWLNLVLYLTNKIYNKKQLTIEQTGLKIIYNILILISLEIFLSIISLPLYLGTKPASVTVFFAEKGTYEKATFDYNLRRVLTLTGVGVFASIWVVKLILIIAVPSIYGPLPLYSVSDLSPVDILSKDLVTKEVGIQTARIIKTIPKPEITGVNKLKKGNYDFLGKGQPGSSIVLLLSDKQTAVYFADVDANGNWQISHFRDNFRLSEGNHSINIFSYNKKLGVRSETAPEQFFKVTTTWSDSFIKNVDVLANWSVVIILLLGAFLTFLTI